MHVANDMLSSENNKSNTLQKTTIIPVKSMVLHYKQMGNSISESYGVYLKYEYKTFKFNVSFIYYTWL